VEATAETMMFHARVLKIAHSGQMLAEIPGDLGLYLWAVDASAQKALEELREMVESHLRKQVDSLQGNSLREENKALRARVEELDRHLNPKPWKPAVDRAIAGLWDEAQEMEDEESAEIASKAAGGAA